MYTCMYIYIFLANKNVKNEDKITLRPRARKANMIKTKSVTFGGKGFGI